MKIFIIFSFLISFAAQASITGIVQEIEVVEHIHRMSERGFLLSMVTDNYATQGRRPRCICDSYTFSYSKFVVQDQVGLMQHKQFSVVSTGFGSSKKIRIHEMK